MKVVHLDQVESFFMDGAGVNWKPLRAELDVRAFGTNAYAAEPGELVVEQHTEGSTGHEEMYVVIRGRARFTVGGEGFDAPAGTVVFLDDPTVQREARAEEPQTLVLAVGAKVGEAYRVTMWEYGWRAHRARTEGRWDDARAITEEGLREYPEAAPLLFALACVEAHEGLQHEAREHLRAAVAGGEYVRKWAEEEPLVAGLL